MIAPSNCPYKELTAPPCWSCQWHNADMDTCSLNNVARHSAIESAQSAVTAASSYEDRLRRYEEDRRKLLELSKEALVDLIIHRPTMF